MNNLYLLADLFPAWFRPAASTNAAEVDWIFYFITWICAFFFVLIMGLMVLFMAKYRARPGHKEEHSPHHNNTIEVIWSVIPLGLALLIFYFGFTAYMESRVPPDDAYEINVVAKKWAWSFVYPNGYVDSDLHVPIDRPVKLIMSSDDVIHSLYIPAFRVKMDCVPGKYTTMWFEATRASQDDNGDGKIEGYEEDNQPLTLVADEAEGEAEKKPTDGDLASAGEPGEGNTEAAYQGPAPSIERADDGGFDLFCTEYCGTGHSSMMAKVIVHEAGGYSKWLAEAANFLDKMSPAEGGETLYKRRGCAQCHSIDGSARIGPSFKGHFGKEEAFVGGETHEIDENYIRESILNPMAKIRAGYKPVMPSYQGQLNDKEIRAIIAYIKSLNGLEVPSEWPAEEGEEGEDNAEGEEAAAEGEADDDADDDADEETNSDGPTAGVSAPNTAVAQKS